MVIEAAWGWYWIADLFAAAGFKVHLAHPLGVAGYRNRRVKNDEKGCDPVGGSVAYGFAARAWIAPPAPRVAGAGAVSLQAVAAPYRAKAQIHAVLGKEGVIPQLTGLWGPAGARWLDDDTARRRIRTGSCRCGSHRPLRHRDPQARPSDPFLAA